MRLLICTPTASLHGGVERIVESLATHLPARGIDVSFALARGARFHDPDAFRRALPAVRGVDVDGRSGSGYGRRRALGRAISNADPDLVLVARMFDAYPVCAELKARGHRLRLVAGAFAFEADYVLDLARYAEFVDLCVTNGELAAAALRQFARLPHVINIPGGVAAPRRLRAPQRSRAPQGALRIGYVGRLQQTQKRSGDLPPFVAELERRAIPFTLDVVGTGLMEDELRAALPTARFHGWLSSEELYERILPELDVLVHFADFEGSPIAPREAMAHGVVPVISRFAGIERELDFRDALTFEVGDVRAAADHAARLHDDRALLERLSALARASQEGIRSELGAIEAWERALRDTLARPQRVGAALPQLPRDHGMLTRLRVPPRVAEVVRRARPRVDREAGDEWPHWSGIDDAVLRAEIEAFGKRPESL